MKKISMITMIQNFHLKLMKHEYIFSENDLQNILDEFNENQGGVNVQNSTTTTDTTEMPNVPSGKTNKPTKTKKIQTLEYGLHIKSAFSALQ